MVHLLYMCLVLVLLFLSFEVRCFNIWDRYPYEIHNYYVFWLGLSLLCLYNNTLLYCGCQNALICK